MFQVEVRVDPVEQKVGEYLDALLDQDGKWDAWVKLELESNAGIVFRKVIAELSGHSPREVKRLINAALIVGRGTQAMLAEPNPTEELTTTEAVQVHLAEEILNRNHPIYDHILRTEPGQKMFYRWSQFIHDKSNISDGDDWFSVKEKTRDRKDTGEFQSSEPSWQEKIAADRLLKDILKACPFPSPDKLGRLKQTSMTSSGDDDLIKILESDYLDKPFSEMTSEDFKKITDLEFDGRNITDLRPLQRFTNLEDLDLDNTQVFNLSPLSKMEKLESLLLDNTNVNNLSPLSKLTNLNFITIVNTNIRDLAPLEDMDQLTLYLSDTLELRTAGNKLLIVNPNVEFFYENEDY